MPLMEQNVVLSLTGGMDTKTDERLLTGDKFTLVENGVYSRGPVSGSQYEAAAAIVKRNGYVALNRNVLGGATISSGQALATFEQELLLFAAGRVYSYSAGANAWS